MDNVKKPFVQSKTVIVYNLDFCNSITSPIRFTDLKGNPKTAYKFNAIKELLRFQSKLGVEKQEFVLFLTIHADFEDEKLVNFINNPDTDVHKNLLDKYDNGGGKKKYKERILRLFVIDTLQNYFRENQFVPHFHPTIFYNGLGGTRLLHFTVFGNKEEDSVGRTSWLQNLGDLCNKKLIGTKNDKFVLIENPDLEENEINNLDSVKLFSESNTYNDIWQQ